MAKEIIFVRIYTYDVNVYSITFVYFYTIPIIVVDSRRASMIRRKAPGPYVDIVGPTVLTVILSEYIRCINFQSMK